MNFNAFELMLTQYMVSNHPDRIADTAFIRDRGELAAATFQRCSHSGMTVDESMAEARAVLFQGLLFSPYSMVKNIILQDTEIPSEDTGSFIMQMVELCRPILDGYAAKHPDGEFNGTDDWYRAERETRQMIHRYMDNNGL